MIGSYFVIDINLPVDEIQTEIDGYIARFEREILIKTLGFDLYYNFIAALSGTPDQKWLDLRDGKIYVQDGVNKRWRGLINDEKESLIAYYVYYQFLKSNNQYASGNGVKLVNSENSVNQSPIQKQKDAYNRMVDLISEMDDFIQYSNSIDSTTYPNYEPEVIRKVNIFNI